MKILIFLIITLNFSYAYNITLHSKFGEFQHDSEEILIDGQHVYVKTVHDSMSLTNVQSLRTLLELKLEGNQLIPIDSITFDSILSNVYVTPLKLSDKTVYLTDNDGILFTDMDEYYSFNQNNTDMSRYNSCIVKIPELEKIALFDDKNSIRIFDNNGLTEVKTFDGNNIATTVRPTLVPGTIRYSYYDSCTVHISFGKNLVWYNIFTNETLVDSFLIKEIGKNFYYEDFLLLKDSTFLIVTSLGKVYSYENKEYFKIFDLEDYPKLLEYPDDYNIRVAQYYQYQDKHFVYIIFDPKDFTDVPLKKSLFYINDSDIYEYNLDDLLKNQGIKETKLNNKTRVYFDFLDQNKILINHDRVGIMILEDVITSVREVNDSGFSMIFKNLYPNPTNNKITLEFYANILKYKHSKIGIFNLIGNNLLSIEPSELIYDTNKGIASCRISVKGIKPGYYFLKVSSGGNTVTKPLIIE